MKLFITATGTNVGKTYVTCDLIHKLSAKGLKVCGYKPVETGANPYPSDALKLLEATQNSHPSLHSLTLEMVNSYHYSLPAAPAVANNTDHAIDIDHIVSHAKALEKMCDILLIEGAGGVMTPLSGDATMLDLIEKLDTPVLLIASGHLGSINDTLLSLYALHSRHIPTTLIFNPLPTHNDFSSISLPYWNSKYKRVIIYDQSFDEIVDLIRQGGNEDDTA